jgi:hypothetical protein
MGRKRKVWASEWTSRAKERNRNKKEPKIKEPKRKEPKRKEQKQSNASVQTGQWKARWRGNKTK